MIISNEAFAFPSARSVFRAGVQCVFTKTINLPKFQFQFPERHIFSNDGDYLIVRRHIHARLRRPSILTTPKRRNRLLLRIELEPGFAVKRISTTTSNRLLVTGKGEHGELQTINHQ